jgi:GNAT superfamily N-acetyltransferase
MAEDSSDDLACFLVGRYEGVPSGCVGLRLITPGIAELTRLYVLPAARRTGGGRALLQAAEEAAFRLGAHTMRLDTRHDLVERPEQPPRIPAGHKRSLAGATV